MEIIGLDYKTSTFKGRDEDDDGEERDVGRIFKPIHGSLAIQKVKGLI